MKKMISNTLELLFGRGSSGVIGSKINRRRNYITTYMRGAGHGL